MIDIRALTANPDATKAKLNQRGPHTAHQAVDEIVAATATRRELVGERDGLRGERNSLSKQIGGLYKAGKQDEAAALKAQVQAGAERIKELEAQLEELEESIRATALTIPNSLDPSVPVGKGDEDNVEIKRWGDIPAFDFEPLAHVELGAKLGILDFDRSTKLAGARFSILARQGARLDRALLNFFLDTHIEKNGYTEVGVPYIVQDHVCEGTGQLPKFADDMFKLAQPLNGRDAYLIPTAEVPITNIHREEILADASLPIKYVGFTPCFRSEAGSAGRDVRGLIRQHQFHKVEMVWIVRPEDADDAHEQLVRHAESLLEALGLPYRRMLLCTGDTSFSAHRCYDLETWMPSQNTYREVSSCSLFTDFQSRRMNMRYRPTAADGKKQKPRYPYTLNGSGLPTGRIIVAILENFQQKDGSVVIPEVLRPYMGGADRITPPGE